MEKLRQEIAEELTGSRSASSMDSFRCIQAVLLSWLERGGAKSEDVVRKRLLLEPEHVAGILALGLDQDAFGVGGSAHTKTWARCAVSLVMHHPSLSGLRDRVRAGRLPSSAECLEIIRKVGQETRGESEKDEKRKSERKRQLEEFRRSELERFNNEVSDSRKRPILKPGVLSSKGISVGLRRRLHAFYGEMDELTVGQVRVLEASLQERRLWVEGPAGSGKTIAAIEIAYRELASGGACAISYHSTQFERMLTAVLGDLPGKLTLLSHSALRRASEMRLGSSEVAHWMERWGPPLDAPSELDLLIVDDYPSASNAPHERRLLRDAASRVIVLSAPEQLIDAIGFPLPAIWEREDFGWGGWQRDGRRREDTPNERAHLLVNPFMCDTRITHTRAPADGLYIETHVAEVPVGFARVELLGNLRNGQRIAESVDELLGREGSSSVREGGVVRSVASTWEDLDRDVVSEVEELLRHYSASQIRILVDPFLHCLGRESLSSAEARRLPPVSGAIAHAIANPARREVNWEVLKGVLSQVPGEGVHLVWTDGHETGLVSMTGLVRGISRNRIRRKSLDGSGRGIFAAGAFSPEFLADTDSSANVIVISPASLFVGLESDAIIYVRSGKDAFERYGGGRHRPDLQRVRNRHHALAMSRARFHLVDIAVA